MGGVLVVWVWTDELLQRLDADGGSVPEHVRKWIHAPIALRVDDDQSEAEVVRLLEFEELSTVPGLARTMASLTSPCACDEGTPIAPIGDLGAAG